jgi:GH15 family glucan-1,4-alpha-glucosidase
LAIRNGPTGTSYDAALAQLAILGYPNRELCEATTSQIAEAVAVRRGTDATGFSYRFVREDDFGKPEAACVMCSFWVAQALARLGRTSDAQNILARVLAAANHVGLFSEHFFPQQETQCGNFPQAYSHLGLINAAVAARPPWTEVL